MKKLPKLIPAPFLVGIRMSDNFRLLSKERGNSFSVRGMRDPVARADLVSDLCPGMLGER